MSLVKSLLLYYLIAFSINSGRAGLKGPPGTRRPPGIICPPGPPGPPGPKGAIDYRCLRPCQRRGGYATGIYCGLGSSFWCPSGSYCDIHPTDAFATCCCKHPPTPCFADPCRSARCPAYPEATCRSVNCGGCFAAFFVNGRKVDCAEPTPCSRRGGTDLEIYCGLGSNGTCPGSSYCDIHPADWFATCCCNDPAATCPNCTRPVNCKVDPCTVSSCPAHPGAVCEADYCGGCNARYYLERTIVVDGRKQHVRKEVTDTCSYNHITPCSRYGGQNININCGRGGCACPGDSYCDIHPTDRFATCCCNNTGSFCPGCTRPVNCFVDPCRYSKCPLFPDAKCHSDYCGGCNARFFDNYKEVTELCDFKPAE